MKNTNRYFTALAISLLVIGLTACEKNDEPPSHNATAPSLNAEQANYKELYRNDQNRAVADYAECRKKFTNYQDADEKCREARRYGDVYVPSKSTFSSQGGSK